MFYKYDLTRTVWYLSNLTQSLLYDVLYYQSQNVNTLLHNSSIAFSWAIALEGGGIYQSDIYRSSTQQEKLLSTDPIHNDSKLYKEPKKSSCWPGPSVIPNVRNEHRTLNCQNKRQNKASCWLNALHKCPTVYWQRLGSHSVSKRWELVRQYELIKNYSHWSFHVKHRHYLSNCGFSSNWILLYFPNVRVFVCPSVTSVTSHISHIYKGINAMLIIRDPSTPIYSESKSSWLSF